MMQKSRRVCVKGVGEKKRGEKGEEVSLSFVRIREGKAIY